MTRRRISAALIEARLHLVTTSERPQRPGRDLLELAATLARRAATAATDIRARGITINRKPTSPR